MRMLFITFVFALLAGMGVASANGSSMFPAWTYYAEIVEHSALIIAAIIGIALLLARKEKRMSLMIAGLVVIIASQVLVNLHHFLIYPFGEWNAIVHHGLLVAGLILMISAYLRGVHRGRRN